MKMNDLMNSVISDAEREQYKRQFELENPNGPSMSVNVGGYGNLIFKDNSVFEQFKKDPQSMTFSQGPGGRRYVEPIDPANIPMGNNRLSPIDQYKLIKEDAGLLSGDVNLSNYSRPLPFGTTEALNRGSVSPQVLKNLQDAAAKNLAGDSNVGRYAVPGYGDQGQFFGGGILPYLRSK